VRPHIGLELVEDTGSQLESNYLVPVELVGEILTEAGEGPQ